nr:3845_t:CDS:2 [Entrophospora candida]
MTFWASSTFLELLKIFDGQKSIAGLTLQESTYDDDLIQQVSYNNNDDVIIDNKGDEFAPSINLFPSAPLSKFSTTGPPLPPKFTSQQPILLSDFSDQPDPNVSAFMNKIHNINNNHNLM